MVKTCSKCGEVKSLDEYYRDKSRRDGRQSRCKACEAEKTRRYYEMNREKAVERTRRWREKNPEKKGEHQRRYREANPEKVAEYSRRYREENRDKIAEYSRRYRKENREKELERHRRYYEANREQLAEQKRRYREENLDYINRGDIRRSARIRSVTSSASNKRGRWSDAEIAILLADDGQSLIAKALELGRTYDSCARKRYNLRRVGVTV